jgi:CcmD family protein
VDNLNYLFFAYMAIWTGIFLFLLQIAKNLSTMQKQVETLQQERESR